MNKFFIFAVLFFGTLFGVSLTDMAQAQNAPSSNVLWASGSSFKGIWPVMRNGIVDAGFKNKLRVRYQAGQGAEASERVLDRLKRDSNPPRGLLLAAAPYALRARIEQTLQARAARGTRLAVVLIGADTGSRSQPRFVSAIVGIDAFATGVKAGKYARAQSVRRDTNQGWKLGDASTLCLRTRSDDPARARLCRGVAAGLGESVAMLTIAHKQRAGEIVLKRLRSYLKKNPSPPLIWLDDGAFTQEVLEVVKDMSDAPLVVFGLARSQKVVLELEKESERIAFIVDLRPFEQGRRAVALLRDSLRGGVVSSGAPRVVTLSTRILLPGDLGEVLPLIGRTR